MPRYIDADMVKNLILNDMALAERVGKDPNGYSDALFHLKTLPTADVVPRSVAREIVEDVKATLLDYHLQESKKYLKRPPKTKKQFDIETHSYRAVTDAIKFALKTLNEIEKKYTEERKQD